MNDIETITLSAGSLACGDCGCEVSEPRPVTVVPVEFVRCGLVTRVPMAQCPQCAARDHQAAEHARQHLPTGVTVGQFRYSGRDAERLLVDAWVAYEAAGVQPQSGGRRDRVRRLGDGGGGGAQSTPRRLPAHDGGRRGLGDRAPGLGLAGRGRRGHRGRTRGQRGGLGPPGRD